MCYNSFMKTRAGFTLVEVIIVIVVLAILIAVSVLGVTKIQERSRDAKREANATVIAESLEKYYDENGEYPSCNALTADGSTVKNNTLKGIDQNALLTPRAPTNSTNTIQCNDMTGVSANDYFAYVVDTSSGCQTGNACSAWILKYMQEESKTVAQIKSRREVPSSATLNDPTNVAVSGSIVASAARGTAVGGMCGPSETVERQLRYNSTNTSTPGTWSSWATGNERDVPALEGYLYTFEHRARCVAGSAVSNWVSSAEGSVVSPITTQPGAVSFTFASTPTVITYTRTDAICPAGTTARYQHKAIGDWGYESAWAASSSSGNYTWNAPNEGFEYTLQVQAQCYTTHATGDWGDTGAYSWIRNVEDPGGAPSNFTHTIAADRKSRVFQWTASTCGPGTQAQHRWNSYIGAGTMTWSDTGVNGWRFTPSTSYSSQGAWTPQFTINMGTSTVAYGVQVQHRVQYICVNTTTLRSSSWGTAGTSQMFTT